MKISFFVSEEQYLTAMQYLLKRKFRTIWATGLAFMLTLGQLIGIIWFCLSSSLGWEKSGVLILLSVLVCVINGFWRLPTRWKAVTLLKRMKRSGQWDMEYEKKHTLDWEQDKLVLQYGRVKRKLPAESISELVEIDGEILIMTGDVLYAVLPVDVFASSKPITKEEWMKNLREKKFEESKSQIQNKRKEMTGREVYRYQYTLSQYRRDMKSYAGTFYIQWINSFLNRKDEKEFRKLLTFHPKRDIELYVTDNEIVILGDIHCLVLAREDVIGIKRTEFCGILYLNTGMAIPIPFDGNKREMLDGLMKFVSR